MMIRKVERYSWNCLEGKVSTAGLLRGWFPSIGVLTLFFFVSSCKKAVEPEPGLKDVRSESQLVKDSVYYYYKLYSLWGDMLNPEDNSDYSFTDAYETPGEVLDALKSLTPYYPSYSGSIDRFSYLEDLDKSGLQSDLKMDTGSGFGLFLSIGAVTDDIAYPVVYFVEGGSPASNAGVRRSDVILSINDEEDLGIPVSCNGNGCQVQDDKIYQSVINKLLGAMDQSTMRLKVRQSNDIEVELTIQSSSYEINPIVEEAVFSFPETSLGYLALSSFEDASLGSPFRQNLDQVFEEFTQRNVENLILDLRYNTGGYVNAAEYLANKIISSEGDGDIMYEYALNDYLSKHPESVDYTFEDVHYHRLNSLNLGTVYMLVTDITASASELLINVLRPYMNVVIIAEHDGTYGKPVGFFKQEIMGRTALWAASFKLVNARGETDYWDGIGADIRNVTDYIFKDFGDADELMISAAIQHARTGNTARRMIAPSRTLSPLASKIKMINEVPERPLLRK